MGKKTGLFEEDGHTDDLQITVNEEYAKRLEHNKAREELHRLRDKHKHLKHLPLRAEVNEAEQDANEEESKTSSSSEDDDEEMDVAAELQDPKFLRMLSGFKKGELVSADESEDDEDSDESEAAPKKPKKKPILLKDLPRDLEGGIESSSEDDDDDEENIIGGSRAGKTYNQELEGAREDFLKLANGGGEMEAAEETDLFGPAKRKGGHVETDEPEHKKQRTVDTQQMLDEYFGKDEDINEDERFLKRFISDKGVGKQADAEDLNGGMDEDDDADFVEAAEKFEAAHNFRFEEEGAERIRTYPREIDGTVRQGTSKRAEGRQRKTERKQQERAKQEAEIQRLKTLKRREIEEKMAEIQEFAGLGGPKEELLSLLDREDFNEEEYDQAMAKAFDNEYYEDEDDKNLEGDSGDEPSEDEDRPVKPGGFRAVRQEISAGGKPILPGRARDTQEVQRLLQEYSKLEYEDIVAGMPTRFRYRQVESDDFGLDTADILSLTDKELNQVVGLRRLAPYRSEHRSKKDDRFTKRQLRTVKQQSHAAKKPKTETAAPAELLDTNDAQQDHRKATYLRPTLPTATGKAEKKTRDKKPKAKPTTKAGAASQETKSIAAGHDTSGMTKSQKKNFLRSLKRKQRSSGAP